MTEIYDRRAGNAPAIAAPAIDAGVDPFILNGQTIREAPARAGRVYALSSGMMTPKTLSNIFARRVVENPQHSIFFVGYADPESPAGILRNAKRGERCRSIPTGRRSRCVARSSSSNSARTHRASRRRLCKEAFAEENCARARRSARGRMDASDVGCELPGSEVIVPAPGVEIEL